MTTEPKDCWQCRLTGGGGLLASAVYVIHQGKKAKSYRHFITATGCGLGILGILRLFDLSPFKAREEIAKTGPVDKIDENEYIIGKFPPKLQQTK